MMRIQCAADFHGKKERYTAFLHGIEKNSPDLIILAGDINSSPHLLKFLEDITTPIFTTSGNMDSTITRNLLEKHTILLDRKRITKEGLSFVGVEGSNPHLDKIYCLEEKKWIPFEETSIDVLISHIPPKGMMDKMVLGFHIGSNWIQEVVKKKKPRLVVCGHIHENYGYVSNGYTMVVNCSVGKRGAYTLINFDDEINIQMVGY